MPAEAHQSAPAQRTPISGPTPTTTTVDTADGDVGGGGENLLPRRLVAGLSSEVLAVPAPPLPVMDEPFSLRLVDPATDAALISAWMNREIMVRTWEYPWPPQRWQRYLRAQLDSDFSRPTLLSYGGGTVGYIEIYRASRDSIATRYDAHPWDLGIHVAIAERALMPAAGVRDGFRSLVAGLFAAEPNCQRVMFDPDHRNTPARLVCQRAGCQALGEHQMSNRRMALYSWPRTPGQTPPAYAGRPTPTAPGGQPAPAAPGGRTQPSPLVGRG